MAASTSGTAGKPHAFDGIAPSASTSVAMKRPPYHVFINHHGKDAKDALATPIHRALDSTGLRVFLDRVELERGDFFPAVLEKAIAGASLHIAIFSENYAQSPWCLAELALMLQAGTTIIPIFYKVQPADLRHAVHGNVDYVPAFAEYERKVRYLEKLEEWKMALYKASFYTGDIIEKEGDVRRLLKNEQMVVKNVVNRVLKDMKKVPLEVAKHPVGLNEAVEEFERIAQQCHGNVQIVGIWGMGGSGKTTLAKEVYNRKCSSVEKRCFLFDIRDAAQKGLLHEKQKRLLEDLGFPAASFDHVDEGKGILASRLTSVSVLIVLDDVDHRDQLEALLPVKDSLGSGSLIIVTTREQEVLISCGISAIYKMKVLNPSHAKQLFCWHAFLQPSPPSGFEQIVEKFLSSCQGLPLSLMVLGGQLYGRSQMDYWEAQLEKISRILPGDITKILKISYDALDEEEKEMFLDAACFFIGEERSTAITVWDGSQWNGLHGLERLVNKCIVELVDEPDLRNPDWERITLIRMHDHLRDLGREIANRQSPYRLWFARQTIHIQPAEEICIRGIRSWDFEPDCFHPSSQGEIIVNTNKGSRSLNPFISGLKIFHGSGDFLNQNVSKGSRELVWLRCCDFEEKNLPSWLYSSESLRILELTDATNLEILWEAATDAPSQLRELVLRDCPNLKEFPRSMVRLKHLKILEYSCAIGKNFSMRSFPEEFCSLQSLWSLKLGCCANLSSLPRRFGELTNLQHLNLYGCSNLSSLPSSIGNLTNLQHLNLEGCSNLSSLPSSIGNLTNLQHLNLRHCSDIFEDLTSLQHPYMGYCGKLRTLPVSFKQLTALQYLNLKGCSELTIESDILENMTRLQYLDFSGCGNMEDLPRHCIENGASLKELYLGGTRIREVPANICQLSKLEILILGSDSLTSLPTSIGNLSSLTTFQIRSKLLTSLPTTLGNLCSLLKLEVMDCDKLECLPDSLGNLCALQELRITGCNKLASLPDSVGNLCSLRRLEVRYCNKLDCLPDSVGNLCSLLQLELRECDILECLPDSLGNLYSLRRLVVRYCNKLDCLPDSVGCLNKLEDLWIVSSGVKTLPVWVNLQRLQIERTPISELSFGRGCKLNEIHLEGTELSKISISQDCCPFLTTLKIYYNDHLMEVETLPIAMETIHLSNLNKLKDISSICDLVNLQNLHIYHCKDLNALPYFAELICLREIEVVDCLKIQKIEGLEYLRSLEKLKICDCPELDGLLSFAELCSLKTFELKRCPKVEKIEGLEYLRSLEELGIWDCPELDGLLSFAELCSLKTFELKGCPKVEKIEGLEYLTSLKKLSISGCPELDGLPCFVELTSLKTFELKGCHKVEKIEGLEYLRSLEELRICDCRELGTFPNLAKLISLREIEVEGSLELKKIKGLEYLRSLEELKICNCPQLDGLPSFAEISSLKNLELKGCPKVNIEGEITSLQTLMLGKCHKVNIEGLQHLFSLKELLISGCPELDGLPSFTELISLETFELKGCPKVEKIEGLEYLTSLENLWISGCPELYELPSFAELTSLKTFELKGCHKVEKIEGLEELRSLKEFKAYTCWKVPCIIRLEKARNLRKLIVVANEKSVVEHCIPTIHQKWPDEVIICTRAVCDVGSFVNSQAFPNLSVLDSFSMKKIGSEQELELRCSSENAILICIIINVVSPVIHLAIRPRGNYALRFEMDLGQGKWVWMGLFTQYFDWLFRNLKGIFLKGSDENNVVESAWLMTGEDEEIRQSFRLLFHTFAR